MGEGKAKAAANTVIARSQVLAPPEEFGRLDLLAPVPLTHGGEGHTLIIYRPTCKTMTEVLDTIQLTEQIERFASACCKVLNGSGEPQEFNGADLSCIDGSDLASVIAAMSADADSVILEDSGDGITAPFIYTLQRPITLSPQIEDSEKLLQIGFEAKRVGDISEYLDSRGETKEFHTFMRIFGKPYLRIPIMTEALINSLDAIDYMVIRRRIIPKFVASRNRWRRVSSPEP